MFWKLFPDVELKPSTVILEDLDKAYVQPASSFKCFYVGRTKYIELTRRSRAFIRISFQCAKISSKVRECLTPISGMQNYSVILCFLQVCWMYVVRACYSETCV